MSAVGDALWMQSQPADASPAQVTARSLAVVVVAHNDSEGLAATVERLERALAVTTEEFEIIVFDDASSDATLVVAEDLAGRLSSVRVERCATRMGAGYCFTVGSRAAASNFVAYVPADNTWPYRSYIELFGNIGKADVITSYSDNLLVNMSPLRRLVSRGYTFALNAAFRLGLHYYNGLTIYPVSFARANAPVASGFGFQAETLIKAINAGCSFIEVALPVDDFNAAKSRSVTLRNVLDAVTMLFRLRLRVSVAPVGSRARFNPVGRSQEVDELGLSAEFSGAPGPETQPLVPSRQLCIAITGASSGIGEALTRAFAADGHRLFICARRGDRLAEIAGELSAVRAIRCDVTDEEDVARFADAIAHETEGLDVLINCAGSFGEIGPLSATDSAVWWETLRTNLFGPYLMIKRCLPLLKRGTRPRIINLAGGGAFSPFPNYSAYACSKAALARLTECLAAELQSEGIRVNAVAPGIIATDIHKATLAAGEERAGRLQYRRTLSIMSDGGPSMAGLIDCLRAMLSPRFDRMTGKTISSTFDPWRTDAFLAQIDAITASDLYTLRRVNLGNLNDGYLRKTLSRAWANFGSGT
jgi:NAD(P)-dependent dehydrogenase (short-subunit alcohol dehydrogenase family)